MSFSEFSKWWLNDHALLARQLPRLKKAVFNISSSDGASEFDGVSELWFESEDQFDAAYASEIGKAVAADSLSKVSRRERILVREHLIFPE